MRNWILTFLTFVAAAAAAAAEDGTPAIIKGFGETTWGQSKQEVSALITPMPAEKVPGERHVPPGHEELVAAGKKPIDLVVYRFFHDKLVGVEVYIPLPAGADQGMAVAAIGRVVKAKYYNTEASEALEASNIRIVVSRATTGGKKSHNWATVQYWNRGLQDKVKGQEHYRRQKEADEAVKKMGLDRLL